MSQWSEDGVIEAKTFRSGRSWWSSFSYHDHLIFIINMIIIIIIFMIFITVNIKIVNNHIYSFNIIIIIMMIIGQDHHEHSYHQQYHNHVSRHCVMINMIIIIIAIIFIIIILTFIVTLALFCNKGRRKVIVQRVCCSSLYLSTILSLVFTTRQRFIFI